MLEIEMKFRVSDHCSIERRLSEWDATPQEIRTENDYYFNAPDRDFAVTGEAFRVRRIGEQNFVTYKGPKLNSVVKTRSEIEVPIGAGAKTAEEFMQLLTLLGYRPVAVVTKKRRQFNLKRGGFDMLACLDSVENVGAFVELEICAPEEQMQPAQAIVRETAGQLGLTDVEPRSYLRMYLQATGKLIDS